MSKALQITSVGWLLISLGHTVHLRQGLAGKRKVPHPPAPRLCLRKSRLVPGKRLLHHERHVHDSLPHAQSSFTDILPPRFLALINYAWSKNPALLRDPVQKAVAGAMIAIMWASGWWYAKNGVTSNAVAVGAIGALQGYSAFTI
ncbi:hypothetical protein MAJ_05481, partial [Metarhizium majus ARSEF 297]